MPPFSSPTAADQLDAVLRPKLQALQARSLYRQRRLVSGAHGAEIVVDGRRCLNFCANDYLGLAADPRLQEAARAGLDTCGTGSGAAALVSGYNREHRALEEALADFLGAEAVLLFSSGWAANLGTLRALAGALGGRDSLLCADELNHASLIDGGRLAGCRYRRVAHADVADFAAALDGAQPAAGAGGRMLVTDAVFSMDGDVAPLAALSRLAAEGAGLLYVDDAHGFGVRGRGGRGSLAAEGLSHADVPVYVATLGKALGSAGAFVAGSRALIDYLVQRARTWVFSTAPPPALAAAARRALAILQEEPERLQALHDNIATFRRGARQRQLPLAASQTPIQPLILGDAARTMAVSAALMARGFWVAGIRPPTVPEGTSRLRITLSAGHEAGQIEALLDALAAALAETAGDAPPAAVGEAGRGVAPA